MIMKKRFMLVLAFLSACNFISFAAENAATYLLENKIPVYVKNIEDSEFAAVCLVFKGGTRYLTPQTSGLEENCLTLLSMGSKNYSYDSLKTFCYEKCSSLSNFSVEEGSVFKMECISRYFDETFLRFEDVFFNPLFSQKEYDLLRTSLSQTVQRMQNDPESMIFYSMDTVLYQDHPFAAKVSVTPESIENITLDAIKKYYASLFDSRRISFVASGNIDAQKLVSMLNRSFGKIQAGKNSLRDFDVPPLNLKGEPVVLVSPGASGASFIARVFPSPAVTDPDYVPSRIVASIFSGILHNVVREKNGICYTPFTTVMSSDAPYGFEYLYRATNLTDFSRVMDESRKILEEGKTISSVDSSGNYIYEPVSSRLEGYVNSYITSKYKSQTSVGGISTRMAASLLQFGDVTTGDELTAIARKTTADDIVRVFKKYWLSEESRWFAVVGPGEEDKIQF